MKELNSCPFHLKDDSIRILWEITPRCNMNCKHCLFFQANQKGIKQELSTEEVMKIIHNVAQDKSVKAIWLSGGEPLLREDIVSVCQEITDCGIEPSLSTNGVLLTSDLISHLHQAGVNYIHLSLDGAKAETHNRLRGVPFAYEQLMKVMDLLNNSPIRTGASFMVTEESIDEVEDVVEIALEKGLSVMSFYLVAELGRGASNFANDKHSLAKQLAEKIEKVQEKQKKTDSALIIEVFRADQLDKGEEGILQECKGDHFLNITYDGKLGACPWLMKSEHGFTTGSLLKENFPFVKEKCQTKMKQKIKERREKLSFCRECSHQSDCGKGCVALQSNENDLYLGLDPICPEWGKRKVATHLAFSESH